MKNNEDEAPGVKHGDYAQAIAGIWTVVLGLDSCERQTNFFDLGGSSLKMMRVHVELQKQLGIEVSIVELFAHPTVDTLAGRLAELRASSGLPQLALNARSASGPLSRIFRRMKNPT